MKEIPNPNCTECNKKMHKHGKYAATNEQQYYCKKCGLIYPHHQRESYKIKNPMKQILGGLSIAGLRISTLAYSVGIIRESLRKCLRPLLHLISKEKKMEVIVIGLYPHSNCRYPITYKDIGRKCSVLIDLEGMKKTIIFKNIKVPFCRDENRGYEILKKIKQSKLKL